MSLSRTTRKAGLKRVLVAGTSAAVVATGLVAAPAHASPDSTPSDEVPPRMARSMAADTGVSRPEAMRRLSSQDTKAALADRLTNSLGARAAGAYIDRQTGRLVVNVTSADAAERVRDTKARPRVVDHSMQRLEKIRSALQESAVTGTTLGIDVRSNVVEVTVPDSRDGARAQRFLKRAGSYGDAVDIARVAGVPRTQAVYGGEAIYGGGTRCSAAFNTYSSSGTEYVLTAGHCTDAVSYWDVDEGYLGPTVASSFPGNDYGAIRNDGGRNLVGGVLHYGSYYDITHADNPPVGTYVCKTGSTTDTTCGYILDYGVTVYYPSGTVYDLIETDVCTDSGDSGGALYASGNTGVGIVSGGTTLSCSDSSFRSYFENATEALNAYGLTLQ